MLSSGQNNETLSRPPQPPDPLAEHGKSNGVDEPPDGGLRAWLQVLGVHITMFNTFGFAMSYYQSRNYYSRRLGTSAHVVTLVASLQILFLYIGTFVHARLEESRFRPLYTFGTLCFLIGVPLTHYATTFAEILLFPVLFICATNYALSSHALSLVSTYFSKKKGLAIFIALAGAPTGGTVMPFLLQRLPAVVGWGWTNGILGLVVLVTMLLSNLILRPELGQRKGGSSV